MSWLLVSLLAGATPAFGQDPDALRAALEGASTPAEVGKVLGRAGLLVSGEPVDGSVAENRFGGLKVDVFRANLFGDAEEETILQLRFRQKRYELLFFERAAGEWRRVPQTIDLDGTQERWCDPRPAPCAGFACFGFEELRRAGEVAIVVRTYGGNCEGTSRSAWEDLSAWQVTANTVRELARVRVASHAWEIYGSRTTDSRQAVEVRFEGIGPQAFPKALVTVTKLGPPEFEGFVHVLRGKDPAAERRAPGPQLPREGRSQVRLPFVDSP